MPNERDDSFEKTHEVTQIKFKTPCVQLGHKLDCLSVIFRIKLVRSKK